VRRRKPPPAGPLRASADHCGADGEGRHRGKHAGQWQNDLVIPWLRETDPFPPPERALIDPNGLLAAGGSLNSARILDAYRRGIFPWSSAGQPLLWWSPDPRMVLYVDELRVSRSLRKRIRSGFFDIRFDTACAEVIAACAEPREDQDGTWITDEMRAAYLELHRLGFVHSVESWRGNRLVGGLYGLALGRVFFGESMFAREADASKVALVHLVAHLARTGVPLIDCQQETGHLASLGGRPIPRSRFVACLSELVHSGAPPAGWQPGPSGGIDP
jgi:leucyl/phenylalanyl-tRNA--protein transferase